MVGAAVNSAVNSAETAVAKQGRRPARRNHGEKSANAGTSGESRNSDYDHGNDPEPVDSRQCRSDAEVGSPTNAKVAATRIVFGAMAIPGLPYARRCRRLRLRNAINSGFTLAFPSRCVGVFRQVVQHAEECRRLSSEEPHRGEEFHHGHGNAARLRGPDD